MRVERTGMPEGRDKRSSTMASSLTDSDKAGGYRKLLCLGDSNSEERVDERVDDGRREFRGGLFASIWKKEDAEGAEGWCRSGARTSDGAVRRDETDIQDEVSDQIDDSEPIEPAYSNERGTCKSAEGDTDVSSVAQTRAKR